MERKDRVDDAMHATRAAVEEGVLPGGGVALLRSIKALEKLRAGNSDQKTGIDIVRKALSWPARQIAFNAGEDGSVVVGKILDKEQYNYGFDAQTGEYGNLLTKGIIDPTKVVRAALQGAASIAGLLITTEAMVAEVSRKQEAPPAMPGGGMDFSRRDPEVTMPNVDANVIRFQCPKCGQDLQQTIRLLRSNQRRPLRAYRKHLRLCLTKSRSGFMRGIAVEGKGGPSGMARSMSARKPRSSHRGTRLDGKVSVPGTGTSHSAFAP